MLFNLLNRKTENPLSGCRLPLSITADAMEETACVVACRASIDERLQAEKKKQVTENSAPVYEFISGHRRGYCGFATGIEVDVWTMST